jgi:hypothetical protein
MKNQPWLILFQIKIQLKETIKYFLNFKMFFAEPSMAAFTNLACNYTPPPQPINPLPPTAS